MSYIIPLKSSLSTLNVVHRHKNMIRYRLKEQLSKHTFRLGQRVTLGDVSEATGIHRVTLSKLSNERGYNAGSELIDKLCRFFNCQPGDLMEYVPDEALDDGGGAR